MPKFRGFIGIDIKTFPKILEFEEEIKKTGAKVKLVEPKNIHITLKFLGDTEEKLIDDIENIIIDAIDGIKPFNLQLKGAGVFPNTKYIKIIWIGIKNGEILEQITNKIDKDLSKIGFKKEKRKFSPHLTIGRVRSVKDKENIIRLLNKYKDIIFADITVESIKLKKSTLTPKGPIYDDLKELKFKF